MKRIRNTYWVIAIIGFIIPVSRVILLQVKPIVAELFGLLFSKILSTPKTSSLSMVVILMSILALVSLCVYLFCLIAVSIDATKQNKRNYVISTVAYCLLGSVFLLSMYAEQQGLLFVSVLYYLFLAGSTTFIGKME